MPLADLQALTQQMFSTIGKSAGDIAEFYKENVSGVNRKRNRDIFEFADLSNLDAGIGDATRLFSTLLAAKNSDKIHKVVSTTYKSLKKSHPQLGESVTKGLAFLSARYPNQFGNIKQIDKVLTPGVVGEAEVIGKKIRLNPNVITQTNRGVSAGTHEILHVNEGVRLEHRDHARRISEKFGVHVNPRLFDPDIAASDAKRLYDIKNPIDPNKDFNGYIRQAHEVSARKAAKTAERSYDSFPDFVAAWGKQKGLDFNEALRSMFEGVTK